MPRVVRLGRPANDNGRRTGLWVRALWAAGGALLLAWVVSYWARLV
jgi:hypothetical protein